jgi:hypothetical protein
MENLCFHSQICYFDFSYFHYWILILKLVLIKSKRIDFVNISFIVFQSRFRLEYRIRDFVFTNYAPHDFNIDKVYTFIIIHTKKGPR